MNIYFMGEDNSLIIRDEYYDSFIDDIIADFEIIKSYPKIINGNTEEGYVKLKSKDKNTMGIKEVQRYLDTHYKRRESKMLKINENNGRGEDLKNLANQLSNYRAFKENFGDLYIVKSPYDKKYYVYRTEIDSKLDDNYLYYTDSLDGLNEWLYGAVMANNGRFKNLKEESLIKVKGNYSGNEEGMLTNKIANIAEYMGKQYSKWLNKNGVKEIIEKIKESYDYKNLEIQLNELIYYYIEEVVNQESKHLEEDYTQAGCAGAVKVDIMKPKARRPSKKKQSKNDPALKGLPAQTVVIENKFKTK